MGLFHIECVLLAIQLKRQPLIFLLHKSNALKLQTDRNDGLEKIVRNK